MQQSIENWVPILGGEFGEIKKNRRVLKICMC